ncbi:MAG: protein phosphatase 2C domain-containing protein [Brasilonema octagenarum HA4186-MV1]|jgi:hypothetical protein|nr:protein phosphatase 2C domain-containing protein [Brasilonema octagenarum HA4186-MV1]
MKSKNSNQKTIIPLSIAKEPTIVNEDAYRFDPQFGLLAIADGVSNGSTLTSFWSNLLVKSFCELPCSRPCEYIRDNPEEWLKPLQAQWQEKYDKVLLRKEQNNNVKTWSPSTTPQAKRIAKGAATFLGVHILPADKKGKGKWQAIAIGDSCVFQFRRQGDKYQKKVVLPLLRSEDFSIKTEVLTSRTDMPLSDELPFYEFDYQLGDIILLATDALSEWLLRKTEQESDDWQKILELEKQSQFEKLVWELRDKNEITFDDTTFCRMEVLSSPQERQGVCVRHQPFITIPPFFISSVFNAYNSISILDTSRNSESRTLIKDSNFNKDSLLKQSAVPKPIHKRAIQLPSWAEHLALIILLSLIFITLIYFPYRKVSSKLEEISSALSKLSNQGTQALQAHTLAVQSNDTQDEGKRVSVKQIVNGRTYRNTLFLNSKYQNVFQNDSKVCFWVEVPDRYFRSRKQRLVMVQEKLRIWRCQGNDQPQFEDAAGDLLPGTYLMKGDRSFSAEVPYNAQFRTVEFYLLSRD